MSCAVAVPSFPVLSPSSSFYYKTTTASSSDAIGLASSCGSPSSSSSSPSSPFRLRFQKSLTGFRDSKKETSPPALSKRRRPAKIDIPISDLRFSAETPVPAESQREVEFERDGVSVYCKKGRKEAMEDRYSAAFDLQGDPKQAFFGIFDGHGGAKAAEYAAENMDKNIMGELTRRGGNEIEDAVKNGYLTTDSEFLKEDLHGGTCCVTALIREGDLVVSNAGDCRAVMSRGGIAEALTSDHRPSRADEKDRIEALGGYVDFCHGGWRLQGSLAVSRGIGDRSLKEWVIAEPETQVLKIRPECEFLILASDGLWDKILRNTTNMGEYDGVAYVGIDDTTPPRVDSFKKVSVLPLVFLIFYEVSGGPFGVENSVGAAGPLLALLGFLIFPLIWSVPEALITAEMGTMFPENGGYVVWVSSALGPYWGFQQGWMKWLSGVIDNALYPVLFLDYLKSAIPALGGGLPRTVAVLVLTLALTYMNYRVLTIVGWISVLLGVFSILPFMVMGLISIPKLKPSRWLVVNIHNVDWGLYLNTLFWNLNYWDSISTLAGEVDNPKKTLPKALFYALILVVLGYFFPLLRGTGAIPLNCDLWTDQREEERYSLDGGKVSREEEGRRQCVLTVVAGNRRGRSNELLRSELMERRGDAAESSLLTEGKCEISSLRPKLRFQFEFQLTCVHMALDARRRPISDAGELNCLDITCFELGFVMGKWETTNTGVGSVKAQVLCPEIIPLI